MLERRKWTQNGRPHEPSYDRIAWVGKVSDHIVGVKNDRSRRRQQHDRNETTGNDSRTDEPMAWKRSMCVCVGPKIGGSEGDDCACPNDREEDQIRDAVREAKRVKVLLSVDVLPWLQLLFGEQDPLFDGIATALPMSSTAVPRLDAGIFQANA
ncbi:uncharacterized protein UTRI_06445 [Ustilago trichophora]|uniref:Uncharacterized protein n=1 Tax=Ustilago trichophora TaxID=86804 RepID=A0A5C3EKC3_9BASI|nr:uncharacterized protein UTRI_06445 [Ustilago trichophora]